MYQPGEAYHASYGNENHVPKGIVDQAVHLLPGKEQLYEFRQELEGPKPLRVIAGLGGAALAFASALGMLNIFALIAHPARFLLQVYEMFFGILITIIELKAFFKSDNWLRQFCYKWFPFVAVLGGKGVFYIFTGSLGLGFGWTNLLVFIPAAFVLVMGVIYILFHFGKCSELRTKYNQTIVMSPNAEP